MILLVRFVREVVDLDARRHRMSSISQYHRFRTYLDLSCYWETRGTKEVKIFA